MSETFDRESVLRRIRALMAKTVENGCTEQEAMTASVMIGKLMNQYGFAASDLNEKPDDTPIIESLVFGNGKQLGELKYCLLALAKYCDVRCWRQKVKVRGIEKEAVAFFGREVDVQVATYLLHLCNSALWSEWATYCKRQNFGSQNRGGPRRDFQRAMATRLSHRFDEMKASRDAEKDPNSNRTGRDLVVVANALVNAAYDKRYGNANHRKGRSVALRASDAQRAGREAGDRVALNPGISQDAPMRRLAS